MTSRSTFKAILLAASAVALFATPAGFAEDAASFTKFSTSAEASTVNVDYRPIQKFSTAFGPEERGRTKISYAAVEQQGKAFMKTYMGYLANVPVSNLTRNDQLAFWLNTRNMLIMEAMADSRSRRRMKAARGTPAEPGKMWAEKRITVEGTELSIQEIEKNIILANFADKPNVIFGLYQGSSGGPGFPKAGFSGANLDAELEAAGRAFLESRHGLKVRGSKAQIPAVVDWYATDVFGGDQEAMRAQLVSLAGKKTGPKLAAATQFQARKFSYSSDELIIRQQSSAGASGSGRIGTCLLYTSPSPRDQRGSRMPSSA